MHADGERANREKQEVHGVHLLIGVGGNVLGLHGKGGRYTALCVHRVCIGAWKVWCNRLVTVILYCQEGDVRFPLISTGVRRYRLRLENGKPFFTVRITAAATTTSTATTTTSHNYKFFYNYSSNISSISSSKIHAETFMCRVCFFPGAPPFPAHDRRRRGVALDGRQGRQARKPDHREPARETAVFHPFLCTAYAFPDFSCSLRSDLAQF